MKGRGSRLLVVDASVVQSAGQTIHPVSSSCRECLDAILRICHRVALTSGVRQEWSRHMSRFALKWCRSMAARRKLVKLDQPAKVPLDAGLYAGPARESIEKDMPLLKAALAAERILVTRDESLRSALKQRPQGAALLRSIRWINPVTDGVAAIESL